MKKPYTKNNKIDSIQKIEKFLKSMTEKDLDFNENLLDEIIKKEITNQQKALFYFKTALVTAACICLAFIGYNQFLYKDSKNYELNLVWVSEKNSINFFQSVSDETDQYNIFELLDTIENVDKNDEEFLIQMTEEEKTKQLANSFLFLDQNKKFENDLLADLGNIHL